MVPNDRRYTKEHEWVKVDGAAGTVGITDFAQKQLGDVVFLELPEKGRKIKAHERFGTVESVKAVSELFSPVGGEVVEVNSGLVAKPETVNADPYGAGWMIRVKLDPGSPGGDLMDAAQYEEFVAKEAK
jgi:glycine cleavage system H protein